MLRQPHGQLHKTKELMHYSNATKHMQDDFLNTYYV